MAICRLDRPNSRGTRVSLVLALALFKISSVGNTRNQPIMYRRPRVEIHLFSTARRCQSPKRVTPIQLFGLSYLKTAATESVTNFRHILTFVVCWQSIHIHFLLYNNTDCISDLFYMPAELADRHGMMLEACAEVDNQGKVTNSMRSWKLYVDNSMAQR